MTLKEFTEATDFRCLCLPFPEKEIEGAYIGDLLSWVMGKAKPGDAWITIMSNLNVIAVASLADVSCIILAEGVTLEDEVLSMAESKGINVLLAPTSAYDTAIKVYEALK